MQQRCRSLQILSIDLHSLVFPILKVFRHFNDNENIFTLLKAIDTDSKSSMLNLQVNQKLGLFPPAHMYVLRKVVETF